MTIYNQFTNLNMDYLSNGINTQTSGFTPVFPFTGWTMPSFNFNYIFPSFFNPSSFVMPSFNFDFSKLFPTDIWNNNTGNNYNWNSNTSIWNNQSYNFSRTFPSSDTFTRTNKSSSSLLLKLVENAKSYLGKVNSDKEGNALFSKGKNQAWCADFVTKVTKDTFGDKLPSTFGSSSVSELKSWGECNNCYMAVPASDKENFIAQNIKAGDIMIEKNNGKSHTGFVIEVNSDGSFITVEGNCNNKVAIRHHSANSSTLSGFISLAKYTA